MKKYYDAYMWSSAGEIQQEFPGPEKKKKGINWLFVLAPILVGTVFCIAIWLLEFRLTITQWVKAGIYKSYIETRVTEGFLGIEDLYRTSINLPDIYQRDSLKAIERQKAELFIEQWKNRKK